MVADRAEIHDRPAARLFHSGRDGLDREELVPRLTAMRSSQRQASRPRGRAGRPGGIVDQHREGPSRPARSADHALIGGDVAQCRSADTSATHDRRRKSWPPTPARRHRRCRKIPTWRLARRCSTIEAPIPEPPPETNTARSPSGWDRGERRHGSSLMVKRKVSPAIVSPTASRVASDPAVGVADRFDTEERTFRRREDHHRPERPAGRHLEHQPRLGPGDGPPSQPSKRCPARRRRGDGRR